MASSLAVRVTTRILKLFYRVLLLIRDTRVIWGSKIVTFVWSHWNCLFIRCSDTTNHNSKVCSWARRFWCKIVLNGYTVENSDISTAYRFLTSQLFLSSRSTNILILSIGNNLFVDLMSCGSLQIIWDIISLWRRLTGADKHGLIHCRAAIYYYRLVCSSSCLFYRNRVCQATSVVWGPFVGWQWLIIWIGCLIRFTEIG